MNLFSWVKGGSWQSVWFVFPLPPQHSGKCNPIRLKMLDPWNFFSSCVLSLGCFEFFELPCWISTSTSFFPLLSFPNNQRGMWGIIVGVNVNLWGWPKHCCVLFWMKLNRFRGRSGGNERRSLAFLSVLPSLSAKSSLWRSYRGLFNPQHLSHFTTQLVENPPYDGRAAALRSVQKLLPDISKCCHV